MMSHFPLTGIRVLDLTHYWAGPHASRIIADFGAEVIKIEYIKRLCVVRGVHIQGQRYNRHPRWHQINRNKYSVTLDFKDVNQRKIFKDLIKISEVILDNFRGGVMAKLGYGYQDLVKIKPDLIVVSMPAFGDSGPFRSYCGVGASLEALSGIQSLTAYANNDKKMRIRELDVIAGIAGASAVMTALLHRQRTGQGQFVDLSQMEADIHALLGEHLLEYTMNCEIRPPLGNRHRTYAPHGCYRCQGEDKWIAIAVQSEEQWHQFCEVLGHPEWKTDERFASPSARQINHDHLDFLVEDWTMRHSHYEAMELLQKSGIAAGAVLNLEEISFDPHLEARGYFLNAGEENAFRFPGLPFRLLKGNGSIRWRGPDLGQHNEHIVCELLGRSKTEVKPINEDEIGTGFDPE